MSQLTTVTRLKRLIDGKNAGNNRQIFRDTVRIIATVAAHDTDTNTLHLSEVPVVHAVSRKQKAARGVYDHSTEAVVVVCLDKSACDEILVAGTLVDVFAHIPSHYLEDDDEDDGEYGPLPPPTYTSIDATRVEVVPNRCTSEHEAGVILQAVRQISYQLEQEEDEKRLSRKNDIMV